MPGIRGVVNALIQSDKYGTPLAQSLRVLAARVPRRAHAAGRGKGGPAAGDDDGADDHLHSAAVCSSCSSVRRSCASWTPSASSAEPRRTSAACQTAIGRADGGFAFFAPAPKRPVAFVSPSPPWVSLPIRPDGAHRRRGEARKVGLRGQWRNCQTSMIPPHCSPGCSPMRPSDSRSIRPTATASRQIRNSARSSAASRRPATTHCATSRRPRLACSRSSSVPSPARP